MASHISSPAQPTQLPSLGIGGEPSEDFTVYGDANIRNAGALTKQYRLRSSGSSLDFDFGGAALILSGYDNADFTGTQREKMILKINEDTAMLLGDWEYASAAWGASEHSIRTIFNPGVVFNEPGNDWDTRIEGANDPYLLMCDASADYVGIGVAAPASKLSVNGDLAIVDGMAAPAASAGYAKIYVDSADGDLKIKFADGTTKTIVVDT